MPCGHFGGGGGGACAPFAPPLGSGTVLASIKPDKPQKIIYLFYRLFMQTYRGLLFFAPSFLLMLIQKNNDGKECLRGDNTFLQVYHITCSGSTM